MEARVDIRKLQMLNDRIAQTLDALNQVRLSVHAVAQTSQIPGFGFPNVGLNHTTGTQNYGQITGAGQVPFGQVPAWYANSIFPQQQTFPNQFAQQTGWNGLSHTSPENVYGFGNVGYGVNNVGNFGNVGTFGDPYFQNRVNQAFPLAQWPVTPFG